MARVKRGTKRRARRKKYLKRTKGFFLTKSKLYQSAQEAANRADRYAFRDRRVKKRQYRRLWIQRIGAAARLNGITYGQLIHGLKAAGVDPVSYTHLDVYKRQQQGSERIVASAHSRVRVGGAGRYGNQAGEGRRQAEWRDARDLGLPSFRTRLGHSNLTSRDLGGPLP